MATPALCMAESVLAKLPVEFSLLQGDVPTDTPCISVFWCDGSGDESLHIYFCTTEAHFYLSSIIVVPFLIMLSVFNI